jgi:hypothetical protein
MSFLYPQFLFGLLAVSIPIVIHLFNFQRPKKVLFTNVSFLKNVKEVTNNKVKLKHLLILVCRIGFIIFLVLAFAQPFKKGKNASLMTGRPDVYFYVDNSYSMQNEAEGDKALDAAIKSVEHLKDAYPYNTLYNVQTNDFEGRDQFMINKEKLSERLSEITYSNIFREGNSIQKRIASLAEKSSKTNNHIFWLTDFQRSTLGDLSKVAFDSSSQYYFLPVQGENTANIFVDSVWMNNPMIRVNENNTLRARLNNTGQRDVNGLLIKLTIDNVQTSTSNINIPANGSQEVSLNFNLTSSGSKKCTISFEDFPVTFDNDYHFVLNVSSVIKVLHLYQGASDNVRYVYGNNKIFELHSNPVGDFDYSLIPLSDLIVLENPESLSSSLSTSLKDFIVKGGSVLIFPSANFNLESYNAFFSTLNTDTLQPRANVTLQSPDFNNPFFRDIFEKADKNMDMPFAYPVMAWQNRGQRILSYKNNDAFLSMFQVGKGKLYLAATTLRKNLTNFSRHGTFLPVMYKIAFQSANGEDRLSYTFQEAELSIPIDSKEENAVYSLTAVDFKIIPDQRLNGRQLIFSLPESDLKTGFYTIMLGDKPIRTLAFNNSRKESMLKYYPYEELLKYTAGKKNVHLYEAGAEKFVNDFRKENVGESLWKYCLILSLLFLLAEILLLRFYK